MQLLSFGNRMADTISIHDGTRPMKLDRFGRVRFVLTVMAHFLNRLHLKTEYL